MFSTLSWAKFINLAALDFLSANPFNSDQFKILLISKVNPLPYSPKELSNSMVKNSCHYDPIRLIIKLIQDLMVISILTKFDADLIKSVDATV